MVVSDATQTRLQSLVQDSVELIQPGEQPDFENFKAIDIT
jgi:hypothetical protein